MANQQPLLLIEPFTVLPQTSGGRTRIFHTIKELNKYFNLTVWSFISSNEEEKLQTDWLKELKIPAKYFETQAKKLLSFFKTGQPYWFSDWHNRKLAYVLQSESKKFSIVQVEFTQLLYLVDYLSPMSQKIFVAHDISFLSFWRRLQSEQNLLKKTLHFCRFLEVYLYECKYLSKFDEVIAVSNHDAAILRSHFGLKNVKVIPNAINEVRFLVPRKKDGYINLGYIGSFDHAPNLEAVKFLLNKILPELEAQKLKYRLYLGGTNSRELINYLIEQSPIKNKAAVNMVGYVVDLKDFYQKVDLLVAPIFAGSGTRIKILESLSFGRPVITTEIGAEGIEIRSNCLRVLSEKSCKNSYTWVKEILDFQNNEKILKEESESLRIKLNQITWQKVLKLFGNF